MSLLWKKTIHDIEVRDRVCLVRVDYNVSQAPDGSIRDDNRIRASLPTLYNLIGRGAKIVLITHLGRPKNKKDASLQPVADRLATYLHQPDVRLADLDDRDETTRAIDELTPGSVMMLHNIRWYDGEKKDADGFGRQLASLGDLYINDAFGTSHRNHASIVGIPRYLPAVAGLLLLEEIKYMELSVLTKPARPFVAIIGGKKASEKIGVLTKMIDVADTIVLGGGIINTFYHARGLPIGKSIYDEDKVPHVEDIMRCAMQSHTSLLLPTDLMVTTAIAPDADGFVVPYDSIPDDMMSVDIGPASVRRYGEVIREAGFVLWIGPMGVYEIPVFRQGNDAIMDAIALSGANAFVGGGDTIASIADHTDKEMISHVSTGGGATLQFIEHGTLPGIEALDGRVI